MHHFIHFTVLLYHSRAASLVSAVSRLPVLFIRAGCMHIAPQALLLSAFNAGAAALY